jgi:formylglycine-generating enzyme required for sulfatase activity
MTARSKHGRLSPRRTALVGAVLGLGVGLPGFFVLEAPLWLAPWVGLIALLGWVGYSAEPVFDEKNPVPAQPRRVRDGRLLMMELPGDRFMMGSRDTDDMAREDEKPPHRVTLSGFRLATTPVTAGLYREIMQGEILPEAEARLPVVSVSWHEAITFCNALSRREGYHPCYRSIFGRWWCDWRADGYRLPTEAEWEYACRAGSRATPAIANPVPRFADSCLV